tara:strand:+ start:2036 stop:2434 length:399 start_codon:yes stop_codon:yes gene_type:complete
MSSKLRGKIALQAAVIHYWQKDEISTTEALLASGSIWTDELMYTAIGAASRHPATLPIVAAYIITQEPEIIEEFITETYQPFVQEYIAPDTPDPVREYREWKSPRRGKAIQSGLKKVFKNRWSNPTPRLSIF